MKAIALAAAIAALTLSPGTLRGDDSDIACDRLQAITALGTARLSMGEAIGVAINEMKAGRPCKAEIKMKDGRPVWEVMLLSGDGFQQVTIDAVDAKVLTAVKDTAIRGLWLFDGAEPGKLPIDWIIRENNPTKQPARWEVKPGSDAANHSNVLAVRTVNDNATYNLAIAEKVSVKDLEMSVRVRPGTGEYDQGGGLIWRCKDLNNYYICRINPLESNYRVYKVVDGKRQQLESAKAVTPTEKWYTLIVSMIGDHITCYLDGKKLLDVRDDTFKEAGMIGLWTKADACTAFDDLVVIEGKSSQKKDADSDGEDED